MTDNAATSRTRLQAQAEPAKLKRLTREEYTNTVNDLFGAHFDLTELLPPDPPGEGFSKWGETQRMSPHQVESYLKTARFVAEPTTQQKGQKFPAFVRQGPRSIDFRIENTLDDLTREAVAFLEDAAKGEQPFFLYMPLTAPHKPTQPGEAFRGKTRVQQHQMVYKALKGKMGDTLHALAVQTSTPE